MRKKYLVAKEHISQNYKYSHKKVDATELHKHKMTILSDLSIEFFISVGRGYFFGNVKRNLYKLVQKMTSSARFHKRCVTAIR